MKILALESSAKAASVCLWEDGVLLAESYQNSGLTHSRTLLPMCQTMLDNCGHQLSQVDVIAVANGPVPLPVCASVCPPPKGWPGRGAALHRVSTLEAMAWNLAHVDGVICCAMDARRKQVYNALFEAKDGQLTRLTPDRAISLEELFHGETVEKRPQILVGDGAELCYNDASPLGLPVRLAPPHLRHQRASGVARAAWEQIQRSGVENLPVGSNPASQLPASFSGGAGTAGADEAGGRPGLRKLILCFLG